MQDSQTYINLARKYRPQVIIDLIGQEALVQTLSNAFKLNRIAHAFMLTGVRGVGKTTTARIIAKALNCTGSNGQGGITLNPCGVCESCISITEDHNMDVIEMDAASKTGVDDVREIIENAKYKPVSSRYKIFIIDEVHMLSKNAFNALLKTLEEPPAHLKFIFATTEIRKVPITVLSRCQRFDLKRVNTTELSQHLAKICNKENVSFDEGSLFLLAKSANGSVRDSLSLLDQAIVYTDRNLTEAQIIEMLGVGAKEDIYNLFLSVINKDNNKTFELLNSQYEKGIELDLLLEDMLEIVHNASVIKITNNSKFLDISENERNKAVEIASITDLPSLIKLWQILIKGIKEVKDSGNSLTFTNMVFSKMLLVNSLGDVGKMIDFLKSQEKKNITTNFTSSPVNNNLAQTQPTKSVESSSLSLLNNNSKETLNKPTNAYGENSQNSSQEDIPPPNMEDYGMQPSSTINKKDFPSNSLENSNSVVKEEIKEINNNLGSPLEASSSLEGNSTSFSDKQVPSPQAKENSIEITPVTSLTEQSPIQSENFSANISKEQTIDQIHTTLATPNTYEKPKINQDYITSTSSNSYEKQQFHTANISSNPYEEQQINNNLESNNNVEMGIALKNLEDTPEEQAIKKEILHLFPKATFVGKENI